MINNDILRSVRYMLDISDAKIVDIIKLAGGEIDKADIVAFLKKEEEDGYRECGDTLMIAFLNGLVFYARGKDENLPPQPSPTRLTNNIVLKKLRVAFEMKEDDVRGILDAAGFSITKPELSALFRKEGHKNYRNCGDQLLRNFLKGLTLHMRN